MAPSRIGAKLPTILLGRLAHACRDQGQECVTRVLTVILSSLFREKSLVFSRLRGQLRHRFCIRPTHMMFPVCSVAKVSLGL